MAPKQASLQFSAPLFACPYTMVSPRYSSSSSICSLFFQPHRMRRMGGSSYLLEWSWANRIT
ncbi:MAG: hypothetical protein ACP5PV_06050 [Methanothrix sp.]